MIAYLRGALIHRETNRAVLDVNGVGYEVFAPARTLEAWAQTGGTLEVHVSTQVREDAITLYGFATATERQAFQILISVSGIGPKIGLACLDSLPLSSLARAVETGDHATLGRVPGVGAKTAQRLSLELKGKLPWAPDGRPNAAPVPAREKEDPLALALARLGYSRAEIDQVQTGILRTDMPPDAPVAERLRVALQLLYRSDS